jgi:hypothetical protein
MTGKLSHVTYIVLLLSVLCTGSVSSVQEQYSDSFSNGLTNWTDDTNSWSTVSGSAANIGGGYNKPLVFKNFEGNNYILQLDFQGNDSIYTEPQIYIYFEDPGKYVRLYLADDNRGSWCIDRHGLHTQGFDSIDIVNHITFLDNKSIDLYQKSNRVKIVRLDELVYVYLNNNLLLTAELESSDLMGHVGVDALTFPVFFDNFYLRPIAFENASSYINELNLTVANPSTRIGSIYTLRLEGIENEKAMFSLNKFGTSVDTAVGSEGNTISLDFENGKEAVNFKLVKLFGAEGNSAVWLEDIISADTDDLKLAVDDISLNPSYYQGENMQIDFSVTNLGNIRYDGMPEITIKTGDESKTINPRLDLEDSESKSLTAVLKAPQKPGTHTLTISVKTEYSTVEESVDYQVRVFNPAVTGISSTLKENNGISGTITMDSPYASDLVDWNTDVGIRVYKLIGVGKVETYSMGLLATGRSFDVAIPYSDFYREDGQYLVTVEVGGMKSTEYFEVIGEDGVYVPSENKIIPVMGSNELYVQLMVLLIGMFAVVSVRNHVHQKHNSIPLNLLSAGCGLAVLVSSFISMNSGMVVIGAILLGIGLLFTFNKGNPLSSLLTRDSHLHDFAGMIILFLSAVYIAFNVPQWSFWVIVGTLIVYSVGLNLYSKVGDGHKKIEDTAYGFPGDE